MVSINYWVTIERVAIVENVELAKILLVTFRPIGTKKNQTSCMEQVAFCRQAPHLVL